MASAGIEEPAQDAPSSWPTFGELAFSLDVACPIPLASKTSSGTPWPFPVAGPSTIRDEDFPAYARRRYLGTLFLSDLLSPIPHFIEDITRSKSAYLAEAIGSLLLSLVQIEKRHRKVIFPIISSLIVSASNPSSEISANIVQTALSELALPLDEQDVIRVASELRLRSRAVDDGAVIHAKKISDELEKRETLIQVAMLFLYISHAPATETGTKRKRDRKKAGTKTVLDDPVFALETLMDRLSVWSAVADLGVGPTVSAEEGFAGILRAFWNEVVKPHFWSKQPELCASFHLKVFARPISPTVVPVTTKKPRKPVITRARPSSDALTQPEALRPPSRASSRAPSETGRQSPSRDRSLSRSLSARPDGLEMRRSRSNSIDPAKREDSFGQAKKGVMRAPSSKDLFRGRQVGFIRRTSSVVGRKGKDRETQSLGLGRTESLARMGLLGRKTSDPKGRRNSEESQNQSQAGTLIFATPSKPRLADSIFGPRMSKFGAPTPIQEEPGSIERPNFVTETPHGPGRMSKDMGIALVTETPMTSTRDFIPGTGTSYAGMAINALNSVERVDDSGDESDPLAELMVMTDEED